MPAEPLRVLIVDDSRIFRASLEQILSERNDVKVIGSMWNGEKALEVANHILPDFVTLDIEMPGMGGIATLKALRSLGLSKKKDIGVLLVSSHTRRGAAVTIEGLQEGAFDFITKPDSDDPTANTEQLKEQLFAKIDAFKKRIPIDFAVRLPSSKSVMSQRRTTRFKAIVIGSSTGGPVALSRVLPLIAPVSPVPIFLVQHLPVDFTLFFATDLARRCKSQVIEARDGVSVEPGITYVAPGGKHLVLNRVDGRVITMLSDSPPENRCRPAADVLFRSAAAAYGGDVLAVVLTGMDCDGAKGALVLKRAGAHVIVQDEATSVVWGMPGNVVAVGAAHQVLPIDEIGPTVLKHLGFED